MRNTAYISDLSDVERAQGLSFVNLPTIAVPHTQVQNRAPMTDLSNDLSVHAGRNRIHTQKLFRVAGEYGPAGEAVWGIVNDYNNSIRLIGNWTNVEDSDDTGFRVVGSVPPTDFLEITFWGTDLNILTLVDAARDYRATVDGGAEGGNFMPTGFSAVLDNRHYPPNQMVNVVSGLSLGLHTVKIRTNAQNLVVYGFEVITNTLQINELPGSIYNGGQRMVNPSLLGDSYNSNFESGVLGTKGGGVLVYLKQNNLPGKAVTPTDSTSFFMGSTNHANEEVIRILYPRDFGYGNAGGWDGPNVQTTSTSAIQTLSDGLTTLVGNGITLNSQIGTFENIEGINPISTSGNYISLTFVGTGVDAFCVSAGSTPYNISIDNTVISASDSTTFSTSGNKKLASGLAYGTHLLLIEVASSTGSGTAISHFTVYHQKTPALPAGAVALGRYNIFANFIANSTPGTQTISQGVMRKDCDREFVYEDGTGGGSNWTRQTNLTGQMGYYMESTKTNAVFQLPIVGVGFDFRTLTNSGSGTFTFSLNGTLLTSTNFPSAVFTTYGTGVSFTPSTGVLTVTSSLVFGVGFVVTGLPYGLYTISAVLSGNNSVIWMDEIPLFHAPQNLGPIVYHNNQIVGNQGVNDMRPILGRKKNELIVSVPGSVSSSTSVYYAVAGMVGVIHTGQSQLDIDFSAIYGENTTGGLVKFWLAVDGQPVGQEIITYFDNGGLYSTRAAKARIQVSPGDHLIELRWGANPAVVTSTWESNVMYVWCREV